MMEEPKKNIEFGDPYEKPKFEKEKELNFPKEITEKFNGDKYCLQCSSCHGCR